MVEPFTLAMAANATKLKPADIDAIQKRLVAAAMAYDEWIKGFDIVISPVAPSPLGYLRGDVPFDTLRERLLHEVGYTLIHNVSGAPAMSLPMGWTTGGLPVGIQFSAANGAEKTLLEIAFEMEAAALDRQASESVGRLKPGRPAARPSGRAVAYFFGTSRTGM